MVKISRVSNGYIIKTSDCAIVIEDCEGDESESEHETMVKVLYHVMESFGVYNSKHKSTRLKILIEKQKLD